MRKYSYIFLILWVLYVFILPVNIIGKRIIALNLSSKHTSIAQEQISYDALEQIKWIIKDREAQINGQIVDIQKIIYKKDKILIFYKSDELDTQLFCFIGLLIHQANKKSISLQKSITVFPSPSLAFKAKRIFLYTLQAFCPIQKYDNCTDLEHPPQPSISPCQQI